MKNLITLVKMQLKEKLNFKRLSLEGTSVFNVIASIVGAVLKFAIVTAICFVAMILVRELPIVSLTKTVPDTAISLLFIAMLALSILSCTIGLTKAMYFSRDNAVLLTLPCRPIQVFLSKLVIFFFFEVKKNFNFLVPLFIAYFIICRHPFYFYPWLILCFLVISMLTVATAALLSIPAMWIATVFRQHKYLQIGSIVVLVSACVAALFYAISLIPSNLDLRANWTTIQLQITNFLQSYAENCKLLYNLTRMMTGEAVDIITVNFPVGSTLLRFLLLLAVTAVLVAASVLIVQPLFYTMSSKPFEYIKRAVKPRKNRRFNSNLSPFINEMIKAFKDSAGMFSSIATMISVPILIFFLNKVFFAMNTKDFGDQMVVAFNLLIMLLILLNINTQASSIYSRDGRSAYLIKVQPKNPALLLTAKLLPIALFSVLSIIATLVVVLISSSLSTENVVYMMLGILFIYLAHLLYCAELDIMNPQTEVYAAMGEHENNPNEANATITAFIISFVCAGAVLLLLVENASPVFPKLLAVGLALFAYKAWTFFSKIKLYYKEK